MRLRYVQVYATYEALINFEYNCAVIHANNLHDSEIIDGVGNSYRPMSSITPLSAVNPMLQSIGVQPTHCVNGVPKYLPTMSDHFVFP